jgi:hypothetical protein
VLCVAAKWWVMDRLTEPSTQANYIVRHWKGEMSLPISYWINGVVINGFLVLFVDTVGVTIVERASSSANPRLAHAAILAVLWSVSIIFFVWSNVGIWRSATNYNTVRRNSPDAFTLWGTLMWGSVAKIIVVLTAIRKVWQLGDLIEIMRELFMPPN